MSEDLNRRRFLKNSLAATAGAAAVGLSFEEKSLLAQADTKSRQPPESAKAGALPLGKLGDLKVSRLICGGNLISGFSHARDLIYVSPLLKQYFTDDKCIETLRLCEEQGVNTAILRYDQDTIRIIKRYWKEGGKLQWICQAKMKEEEPTVEVQNAIDQGAAAVYIHGGVSDSLVAKGRSDLLGVAVRHIQGQGVPAGIAGHNLDVQKACEKDGVNPDFYMKTYNSKQYWSAGPMPRHDSVWAETPEETREFMGTVKKPWIAYKILGAGAIKPEEGFKYAFEGGADFICVGMFDFQVAYDVKLTQKLLAGKLERERPWRA